MSRKRAAAASIWLRGYTGVALLLLASCSGLPPVSAVDLPPIRQRRARIWFYRVYDPTESKGRPYIYMNGAVVGLSNQGYAFYRDVPAGLYQVSVESYGDDFFNSELLRSSPDSSLCEDFISAELGRIRSEFQS